MATVIVLFVWEKLVLLLNQADLFRPLLLNLIILMSDIMRQITKHWCQLIKFQK